jgi:Na+/melibiose symporter-like transporter
MAEQTQGRGAWSWWYLLLLIQFIAVLWPPFYNKVEPAWGGMPFFYWYQLVWVIIGAILTAIVYFATRDRH